MIAQFQVDTLLCILQVSVTVLFGLCLIYLLSRYRSSLAVTTGHTTICLILGLSLAIVVPTSNLFMTFHGSESPTAILRFPQVAAPGARHASETPEQNRHESNDNPTALITLSRIRSGIMQHVQSLQTGLGVTTESTLSRKVFLLTVSAVFFGLLRFLNGLRELHRLLRNSREISSREPREIASQLAKQMGCRRHPEFRQCESVTCAAVVGWRNPKILLPADWKEWTDLQLRCVIAHELAHISHNDFAWRLLSALATSLHFFNPLVHVLVRRIAFAQEVMADHVVANLLGADVYVRSLSQLALKHERTTGTFPGARIAPIFSGYLIRRIKMLKTDSSSVRQTHSQISHWSVVAAMSLVGIVAFASKALAGPQEKTATQRAEERVARATDSPTVSGKPSPLPNERVGMFQQSPIDLEGLAPNKHGIVVAHLDKLRTRLKTEDLGVDSLINKMLAEGLHEALNSEKQPTVDVANIETFIGDFIMSTRFRPTSPDSKPVAQPNSVSFGVSSLQIVMKEGGDCSEWLSDFAPKSKTTVREDKSVHVVPIPTFGPNATVANLNDRTVVISNGQSTNAPADKAVDHMFDLICHEAVSEDSTWLPAFRRVEGGLVSLVFTNEGVRTPAKFEQRFGDKVKEEDLAATKAFHRLEHSFETMAVGVDVAKNARTVGLRIRLGVESRETAETMLTDAQTVCQYLHDTKDFDLAALKIALGTVKPELVKTPESTWEIVMDSTINVPGRLPEMAAALVKQELDVNEDED